MADLVVKLRCTSLIDPEAARAQGKTSLIWLTRFFSQFLFFSFSAFEGKAARSDKGGLGLVACRDLGQPVGFPKAHVLGNKSGKYVSQET